MKILTKQLRHSTKSWGAKESKHKSQMGVGSVNTLQDGTEEFKVKSKKSNKQYPQYKVGDIVSAYVFDIVSYANRQEWIYGNKELRIECEVVDVSNNKSGRPIYKVKIDNTLYTYKPRIIGNI